MELEKPLVLCEVIRLVLKCVKLREVVREMIPEDDDLQQSGL